MNLKLCWPIVGGVLMSGLAVAQVSPAEMKRRLDDIDKVVSEGPYRADWDSLTTQTVPDWYLDAKFGIFIHWGVYSVPAFGSEWYPRQMYQQGSDEYKHHIATYGAQNKFGYKDFIPLFKAEKFDANAWAQLFEDAGAKFVVPVAEHHDGFPMYDCGLTKWNAKWMGPKRDVVGELSTAVRSHRMVFGVSSHRAEHWWFYNGGLAFDSDVRDLRNATLYGPAQPEGHPDTAFLNDWLARTCELVDKYHPQLVWFDWWIEQPEFESYRKKFAAFLYNRGKQWGKGVALNYKNKSFPDRAAVLDIERGQLAAIRPFFWQTDTSISNKSWGYIDGDEYRTSKGLIDDLVDIVSKNGALLLNVGPKSDGTIPEAEQEILRGIGAWLRVNGEAIYGTRPWKTFGEGPTKVADGAFSDTKRGAFTSADFRFTSKGTTTYAVGMEYPSDGFAKIVSMGVKAGFVKGAPSKIALVGSHEKLVWRQADDALYVNLPPAHDRSGAYVLKIEGF